MGFRKGIDITFEQGIIAMKRDAHLQMKDVAIGTDILPVGMDIDAFSHRL